LNLNYYRKEIDKKTYLNFIKTNKFKTNLINIYFIRPLIKEEATINALLPLVLKRGTKNYNTSLDIQRKLEELYGANLSIDVSKKGERQVIRFTIEAPDASYTESKDLIAQAIEMLNEIINQPLLEDKAFLEKYVEQEKENLRKKIKGRINDKKRYAIDRCIEEMCENENFKIYKYGYVEDLNRIDGKSLYKHYQNVLATSNIEISAVGDICQNDFEAIFKQIFTIIRGDIVDIPRETIDKQIDDVNVVLENMDVSQGKLTLGYRMNIPYEDKLYDAFMIANEILGGGPNSKLFLNVREKESLAYYVFSQSYKFKSIMLMVSGIESENYDMAVDIMKKQVDEIQLGQFSESDIDQAKNSIMTSIVSLTDDNYSLSEFYLSQALTGDNRTIDNMINQIMKVNKSDIIESFQKLKLDTIYFLSNKGNK
jgi:predicted Zn-dependent peptidase